VILVTGAAGRLGGRIAKLLMERGYEVVGTDQAPFEESPSPFRQLDLCHGKRVEELMEGAEGVIHTGAIPGPPLDGEEVFENNVLSTFNVLRAAAKVDVRRVVFSSSAFAMGFSFDPTQHVPRYLPLDEDHPVTPFEPYGLSKQVGEKIGEMVARGGSTSVASLRFTNVVPPEKQIDFPVPGPDPDDPSTHMSLVKWAYADPRDVAEAHVRALEAEFSGHEAFLLAQPITRFREDTLELVRRNFGDVEIRGALEGNASVISSKKAERVLGFSPQLRWDQRTP
jgi:nucleoside-diphosphate-sugar epimerase